jgi:hypothetical protein
MAIILKKKYTKKDSIPDITSAILKLSTDKHGRVLLADEEIWKGEKLKEIARLARIVRSKLKNVRITKITKKKS